MPDVPIIALSATCPPAVLKDMSKALGLKEAVDGRSTSSLPTFYSIYLDHFYIGADTQSSVYFSAPLYRANLHYKIVPKHHEAVKALQDLTDYILKHHTNDTGIVYCMSKTVRIQPTSNLHGC
jgi:ATP-dependent DNA helicase Q1